MAMDSLNHIEQALYSVLRDTGFTAGKCGWTRVRDEFIDCADVQVRSDNAACCVNLGVHLHFLPVAGGSKPIDTNGMSSVDCEIKSRLVPEGKTEYWWEPGGDNACDVGECFRELGEKFFRRFNDFPRPFSDIEMSEIDSDETLGLLPTMTKVRRILLITRVYDYLNDSENAVAWAEFGKQNAGIAVGPKSAFRDILRKYK